MTDKNFSLGTIDDDSELRECLRSTPMDGSISIAFETEPSFFDAIGVQGKRQQVIVCRDQGQLAGFGTVAFKPIFVNGGITEVGYLSGLRVYPQFRNRTFLARGYKFLRELDDENNVPFYLTTIVEDNHVVRRILESGKAGLPKYNYLGTLSTFLIKPKKNKEKSKDLDVVKGDKFNLEEILNFMRQEGQKKQFYPFYEVSDLNSDYLRGLNQEDFYVASRGSEIIGIVAKWDQKSFKQTRVVDYDRKTSLSRSFINLVSRFTNVPRLPPKGDLLNYFYAAFPTTKDNDPDMMEGLLTEVASDTENNVYNYFTIGLMENDPLAQSVRKFNPREYRSRLYLVSFDKTSQDLGFLNERIPYLELGTL
tara:strand:- start:892 stop:1986 length:1095 start_codon:yes stop_codon:yes gene_type:complete